MHYVTHRSHRVQKHKFGVMCPGALFMETTSGPPKQEKYCVDVSRPGRTRIHYVICRSHQIQKHKFDVMCPDALFVESVPVPSEHKNSELMFRARTHRNAPRDRHIPPDSKT
jgi:hypothetical protein